MVCALTKLNEVLQAPDIELLSASSGSEALIIVKQQYVDAVVIDLRLNDIAALELVQEIQEEVSPLAPPTILYSKRLLTHQEQATIKQLAARSIIKHAQSPERLLDETALLLHRAEADLSENRRQMLEDVRRSEIMLAGKRVLVVDDDIRNIFALSSILEQHKLKVLHAENGKSGIEVLKNTPEVDLVLMDIMMPGMDGYATMRAIREIPQFRLLPIIAVTAKAMKGDRDKCIEPALPITSLNLLI